MEKSEKNLMSILFRVLDIVSEEEAEDFLYNGSSDIIVILNHIYVGKRKIN